MAEVPLVARVTEKFVLKWKETSAMFALAKRLPPTLGSRLLIFIYLVRLDDSENFPPRFISFTPVIESSAGIPRRNGFSGGLFGDPPPALAPFFLLADRRIAQDCGIKVIPSWVKCNLGYRMQLEDSWHPALQTLRPRSLALGMTRVPKQ